MKTRKLDKTDIDEKPVKHKRVRKHKHSNLHEGEGEGWAVSYSDLLMVLMSFFIIFYNTDDTKKDRIDKIIAALKSSGIKSTVVKENKKEADPKTSDAQAKEGEEGQRSIAAISLDTVMISKIKPEKDDAGKWSKLLKKGNDASKYKGGVLIDLPDNIYRNGKYNISDTHKKQLVELFEAIKPYQEHINLVFIGHTDQTPIKSKFGVIESNLILSHLRAAKAVEFAIEKGFDPMWVSSQGLSEYTRNTRSLSVRIMER